MFRNEGIDAESFRTKFEALKERFDSRTEGVQLDSEYHKQLKGYILGLYSQVCGDEGFDDERFGDMREAELSNLNRLQKMKNGTSYKKEKHKAKQINEDWG